MTNLKIYILAYVDNTVVKRKKKEDRIKDLKETSFNFHIASLKLNLEKCIFRVQKWKKILDSLFHQMEFNVEKGQK